MLMLKGRAYVLTTSNGIIKILNFKFLFLKGLKFSYSLFFIKNIFVIFHFLSLRTLLFFPKCFPHCFLSLSSPIIASFRHSVSLPHNQFDFISHRLFIVLAYLFSDCHDASLTLAINPNFEPHFVPYLLLSFQSCFRGGFVCEFLFAGLLFAKLSLNIQCGICWF